MFELKKSIKIRKGIEQKFDLPLLTNLYCIPNLLTINNKDLTDIIITVYNKDNNNITLSEYDKAYFMYTNIIKLDFDDIKNGSDIGVKVKYNGNMPNVVLDINITYKKAEGKCLLLSKQYFINSEKEPENMIDDIIELKNSKRMIITIDNSINKFSLNSNFDIIKGQTHLWDNEFAIYEKEKEDNTYCKQINDTTYEINLNGIRNLKFYKFISYFKLNIYTQSKFIFVNIFGFRN
jgi:hypothetical protein